MNWLTLSVALAVLVLVAAQLYALRRLKPDPPPAHREPGPVLSAEVVEIHTRLEQLELRMTSLHEEVENRYKRMHGLVAQQRRKYNEQELDEEETETLREQLTLPTAPAARPNGPTARARMVPKHSRRR